VRGATDIDALMTHFANGRAETFHPLKLPVEF
jgi:hypothetical protein